MMRRSISVFVILALVLSILPFSALAASSLNLRTSNGKYDVSADSSVTVKWNSFSGAKDYVLTMYDNTVSKTQLSKSTTKTSLSISSSYLAYARNYTITVTARNKSGKTLCTEKITVKTYAGKGSCTTSTASVSGSKVTFKFSVDTNGGTNVSDCGIVYGTSKSNLNKKLSYGSLGAKKGTFSVTANLSAGTTYYYKAYVTNASGTAYGSVRSVTTGAAQTLKSKSLSVTYYSQGDSRWKNEYVNTKASTKKTIGNIGCALTCISMVYSYKTGTSTTPLKLRDKWKFDGNSVYWTGFNAKSVSGAISQSSLKTIYDEINKGNPVIIGAYPSGGKSGTWHYVVVTGYKNLDVNNMKASAFTINDPGNSSRKTLQDLFNYKPNCGQVITITNTGSWSK